MGREKEIKNSRRKTIKALENEIAELSLNEAMDYVGKKNTKLVWLGTEPEDVISRAIDVPKEKIIRITPEEIIYYNEKQMKKLNNHVFAGYNDSTSKFVIRYMKNKCSVEATSLKGGINGIIGDIL
ncbi:MAG: hypothetical protein M1465_00500 [Candidatus Marsarchaeota archaeon]|jgi:hypothetical protein|nr:hypothetical protein [Candidatus Marsarchaeota archaeon]